MQIVESEAAIALEKHALRFATRYLVHPVAVADLVRSVPHTPDMIAAALLHDTVEDTAVTLLEIKENFGANVARLVAWLSDVSTPFHGNRAIRKELDRQHLALAPPDAKTIKLADLIDNSRSIREGDPDFWQVFRREKMKLLEVLGDGDRQLFVIASSLVVDERP